MNQIVSNAMQDAMHAAATAGLTAIENAKDGNAVGAQLWAEAAASYARSYLDMEAESKINHDDTFAWMGATYRRVSPGHLELVR